ncbi:alkaline phosphatase PhoX [Rubinisphaera italica]|uniref:Phosphatase n=1 Tax=Rubinisphaera italica TaxID=2527969 RepID=A0A5C5XE88_9PLAN|nr:alkaline phosphatase PhoX [Rubinisphaera italica]TWT61118.1 hypothetical protein Pan54_18530 [Rubinisphaera italica]
MSQTNRRQFLKHSLASASGISLAQMFSCFGFAAQKNQARIDSSLQPVTDDFTGLPLLKLPEGFTYRSFGWTGEKMSDGIKTPGAHDGMAVVKEDESTITLIRNHELSYSGKAFGNPEYAYDAQGPAGCTTLVVDRKSGELLKSYVSLSGTSRNCAGGPTPWGTWLTCEETISSPQDLFVAPRINTFQQTHGWVFEANPDQNSRPEPIKDMGCFWHEAVAVDAKTGIVYLTEDRKTGGFYRYLPSTPGKLAEGGELQMLSLTAHPDFDANQVDGQIFDTSWVTIDKPHQGHSPGTRDTLGVYKQGTAQKAVTFDRVEGCFIQERAVYFSCTEGGREGCGQIWRYLPDEEQLELVYESKDPKILNMPDNIAVHPNGAVAICEDSNAKLQRMHFLTKQGQLKRFADNNMILNGEHMGLKKDYRKQEWAGATFSADGQIMFVNIQTPGVTFAIRGPWQDWLNSVS